MKSAREHLESIAYEFWIRSADAHAKGMSLARISARIGQLGQISTEDEALESLDIFVQYGTIRMVNGEYEVVEEADDMPITMTTNRTGLG